MIGNYILCIELTLTYSLIPRLHECQYFILPDMLLITMNNVRTSPV